MSGLPSFTLPLQLGLCLLGAAAVALKTRVAWFHGFAHADDDPLRYWAAIWGWLGLGAFLCLGSLFGG